jgi:hypothetical protein
VSTYEIKGSATEINEMLKPWAWLVSTVDDKSHIRGQHKGSPVPTKGTKHLRMTKNFSKVDMKKMPAFPDHDVIVVTITDAQDVRSDAVPRARGDEIIYSRAIIFLCWVVFE